MIGTNRIRISVMLVAGFAAALFAAVPMANSARGENIIFSVFNTDDSGQGSETAREGRSWERQA